MDNFDLKKYLAEGKLLKEELTYTFSEYDYDINDDAYQAEVEAGIKAKHPKISDEDLQTIINSSVEYYYEDAKDENKRGRDADPTPSSSIVSMAVDYYEDEFLEDLDEGKLNENQGDMYGRGPAYQALDSGIQYYIDEFINDINADIEEGADKASVTGYLNDLIKAIAALRDSIKIK